MVLKINSDGDVLQLSANEENIKAAASTSEQFYYEEDIPEKGNDNCQYNALRYQYKQTKNLFCIDEFYSSKNFVKEVKEKKHLMDRILHKIAIDSGSKKSTEGSRQRGYCFGGIYKGKIANDLVSFELDKNKQLVFNKVKTVNSCIGRVGCSFDLVGKYLVLIGGVDATGATVPEIQYCPLNTLTWETADSNSKLALYGHATAVHESYIFIFGGCNEYGYQNMLYRYSPNLACLEPLGTLNISPRAGSSMLHHKNNLYIFGGQMGSNVYSDLFEVGVGFTHGHRVKKLIHQFGPGPALSYATSCATENSSSYLFYGGWTGNGWSSSLYELDFEKKKWGLPSTEPNQEFDLNSKFSTITQLSDTNILLGGTSQPIQFTSIGNVVQRFLKKEFPLGWTVKTIRSETSNTQLENATRSVSKLAQDYLNWCKNSTEADCDVIVTISSSVGNHEDINLYCHKFILHRSSVLKRLIALAELKKQREDTLFMVESLKDNDYLGKYQLKHGDQVSITINHVANVANMHNSFPCIVQYLYSGCFFADVSDSQLFNDIFTLASYFRIELLASSLINKGLSLELFQKHNHKCVIESITEGFLRLEDEIIEDIEEYKNTMGELPPLPSGFVKIVAPDYQDEFPIFKSILVHKGLISARASYFKSLFGFNFMESLHGIVIFDSISIHAMYEVVYYLYTSSYTKIQMSHVVEIYMLSHQMELDDLQHKARNMIREHDFDEHTAINVLGLSESLHDKVLKDFCLFSLAKRYDQIQKHEPSLFNQLTTENRVELSRLHLKLLAESKKNEIR